eukprot:7714639-Ditylum_brightwellii.AAC.1
MEVDTFNLLVVGMLTMSSIAAVFLAEICAVISSSDRPGGRRLRILTSLSRKALSSDNSIFLRHILRRRLQKRDPMWGGEVSLNRKSLVLLGTTSRKSKGLSAYICAQLLVEPVTHKISLKSWDRSSSLICFVSLLAVTRVEPHIICCATLTSGDVLFVAANAA